MTTGPRRFPSGREIALLLSLCVTALGIVVLAGWAFEVSALKSVLPGQVTMKVNTAILTLLCGAALALLSPVTVTSRHRFSASIAGWIVVTLSTLTLAEYVLGRNLGIDQVTFFDASVTAETSSPGRMSPATALCFLLVGIALLAAARPAQARSRIPLMAAMGVEVIVVGGLCLGGYIVQWLLDARWWSYTGMAIHTATGLVVMGVILLALVKAEGGLTWALDKRITAGCVAATAVMLAAAAATYNLTNRMVDASAWVSHTHEVLKEINAAAAGLADLEGGQRGFIITGDEPMLRIRADEKAAVLRNIAEMRRLTSDNPSQQKRLSRLEPLVTQRIAFGDRTIAARRLRGFAAAEQMVAENSGVGLTDEIQQVLSEMRGEEYRLLDIRQIESSAAATAAFLILPLGAFLSVAILSLGLFHFNVDVRERKDAEALSDKLAAIVESSNDAIIGKDLQGVVVSWNAGAERTFGYTASEMQGQPITRLIPLERQREETEILHRIRRGEDVAHFETVRLRKDGRPIDLSVNVSPIKDGHGRVVGASKVARDITERKGAERQIRELNADLERRVRERTAQFETANKELEAFSYSISHDLRAPLRGIDSFVQMLHEDHAEQLDAEGKRMLNVVSSEAKRMGRLIDDLLAFSRLSRQQIASTSVDMSMLARAAFESMTLTTPISTQMARFELKPLPPARGDIALLRQVFDNLIGNAIKYSGKRAAPVIEVGGWSGDSEATYYVKDNGVGFDERFSDKLFGVFQRLHSEEEFEGTGVGLAIVQRVIHRHGGKVRAQSKPGEGAAFYFTLPTQGT